MLGATISLLADDPLIDCPISPLVNGTGGCPNPNTTFFTSRGVTGSDVALPDAEAIYRGQFASDADFGVNGSGTGPSNSTGTGSVDTIQEFFEQIDFLNIGELIAFLEKINPFLTIDIMFELFDKIGIQADDEFLLGIKAIFFFLGVLAFIFVIFKIDLI